MRTRIDAAERLALSGAIERAGALRRLPLRASPRPRAASGTGRGAVQALDAALAGGDAGGVGAGARSPPTRRSRARGLRVALARGLRRAARRRSIPAPLAAEARRGAGRAAAARRRRRRAAARAAGPAPDAAHRRAARDRRGRRRRPAPVAGDLAARRRSPGSPPTRRPTTARRGLAAMLADGRQGAGDPRRRSTWCRPGRRVDPPALRAALLTLRLAGQDEAARDDRAADAARGPGG